MGEGGGWRWDWDGEKGKDTTQVMVWSLLYEPRMPIPTNNPASEKIGPMRDVRYTVVRKKDSAICTT